MPVINVLDKHVAELIAAGEVVERPSSIVKELIENSIDAGARNISVEISGGGVRLIRIIDDGCGISREDLPKAFLRHATSKVCQANDLDGILTLGFRGEALASVAAMCRVEIVTKTDEEDEGTSYSIEGGECMGCVPVGCPTGTTFTVRDVFFNTPARMKFLKKDVSEGNSVAQVVDKCALSHPEIAFKFIRDGSVKFKTSGGGDLLAVIYEIYGREFAGEMLEVDYVYEKFARVSGYISKPNAAKPSRAYQNFFINRRFVKTKTGMAALEEAYKNKIMSGKYPSCFLNLELDAADVDVNVHPAKLEVRFVNEKPVFSSVYYAVKTALQKLETPLGSINKQGKSINWFDLESSRPESVQERLTAQEFRNIYSRDIPVVAEKVDYNTSVNNNSFTSKSVSFASSSKKIDISVDDSDDYLRNFSNTTGFGKIIPADNVKIFDNDAVNQDKSDTIVTESQIVQIESMEKTGQLREFKVIGELFGTYIVIEENSELVLVDKHAAHERILYEKLKSELSYGNRQVLLSSQIVPLLRDEHEVLLENSMQVEKLGFLLEDFGGNAVAVREIPIQLNEADIAFILCEIADKLKNNNLDLTPNVLDRLYYSIACRSAVKAHDKSSTGELAEIVRKLNDNPSITHCPHGRPVLIRLSRREIEKMFGRLG